METNMNSESFESLSPPVLTPEVNENKILQSTNLRCCICDSEDMLTDIELYNHIKYFHGDNKQGEVIENYSAIKRKSDFVMTNPASPDKIQKTRNTNFNIHNADIGGKNLHQTLFDKCNTEHEGSVPCIACPKCKVTFHQISDLVMHIQVEHSTGNEMENQIGKSSTMLSGKGFWCEQCFLRIERYEDWKEHQQNHKIIEVASTSVAPFILDQTPVQSIAKDTSSICLSDRSVTHHSNIVKGNEEANSGGKNFDWAKKMDSSVAAVKRCVFRPDTTVFSTEDSMDIFPGRTADSVFSPVKNDSSPAKVNNPAMKNSIVSISPVNTTTLCMPDSQISSSKEMFTTYGNTPFSASIPNLRLESDTRVDIAEDLNNHSKLKFNWMDQNQDKPTHIIQRCTEQDHITSKFPSTESNLPSTVPCVSSQQPINYVQQVQHTNNHGTSFPLTPLVETASGNNYFNQTGMMSAMPDRVVTKNYETNENSFVSQAQNFIHSTTNMTNVHSTTLVDKVSGQNYLSQTGMTSAMTDSIVTKNNDSSVLQAQNFIHSTENMKSLHSTPVVEKGGGHNYISQTGMNRVVTKNNNSNENSFVSETQNFIHPSTNVTKNTMNLCENTSSNPNFTNVSTSIIPCVIQPATNVPSQNISVLSQQAKFISRPVKDINYDNMESDLLASTQRPVSTCIIQPAVTSLTYSIISHPAFTNGPQSVSSFSTLKNSAPVFQPNGNNIQQPNGNYVQHPYGNYLPQQNKSYRCFPYTSGIPLTGGKESSYQCASSSAEVSINMDRTPVFELHSFNRFSQQKNLEWPTAQPEPSERRNFMIPLQRTGITESVAAVNTGPKNQDMMHVLGSSNGLPQTVYPSGSLSYIHNVVSSISPVEDVDNCKLPIQNVVTGNSPAQTVISSSTSDVQSATTYFSGEKVSDNNINRLSNNTDLFSNLSSETNFLNIQQDSIGKQSTKTVNNLCESTVGECGEKYGFEVNSNIITTDTLKNIPQSTQILSGRNLNQQTICENMQNTNSSLDSLKNLHENIDGQSLFQEPCSVVKSPIHNKQNTELVGPPPDVPEDSSSANGAIVLYCCGINTNDHTVTSINQTKLEDSSNSESMREGIFVVCTNCGTNSAKYDKCDSCCKPLPHCAKLYEPIIRQRSFSEGSNVISTGLRQKRNLSDTAIDDENKLNKLAGSSSSVNCKSTPVEVQSCLNNADLISSDEASDAIPKEPYLEKPPEKPDSASNFASSQSESTQTEQQQILDITKRHDVNTLVVQLPVANILIGTYKAVPADLFKVTTKGIQLTFEHNLQYLSKFGEGSGLRIHIGSHDLKNIKVNLNKQCPVMLLETSAACEQKIQQVLGMTPDKEPFFSLLSEDWRHKRIVLFFKDLGDFGIEKYLQAVCKALSDDHPLKQDIFFEDISFDVARQLINIPLPRTLDRVARKTAIQASHSADSSVIKSRDPSISDQTNTPLISNRDIPVSEPTDTVLNNTQSESGNSSDNNSVSGSVASGNAHPEEQNEAICLDEEEEDVIIVNEVHKQSEFKKDLAFLKPTRGRVKPKLLEIQSNCNWTKIRGKITSVMSKVLGNRTRYPDQRTITLDHFCVTILPKPKQQTRVPKSLISKFEGFFVYPVCIKITPLVTYTSSKKTVIDLTKDPSSKRPQQIPRNRLQSSSNSTGGPSRINRASSHGKKGGSSAVIEID